MAGKKMSEEDEILEAVFEELSLDDIPGASADGGAGGTQGGEARRGAARKKKALAARKKGLGGKKKGVRLGAGGGAGGAGLGPGGAMRRKKKKAGARRAGGGASPDGRSDTFEDSVTGGREMLKQLMQRLAPEDGDGEGKRKGVSQALRRVARGYRELETEVARLEGELARKP